MHGFAQQDLDLGIDAPQFRGCELFDASPQLRVDAEQILLAGGHGSPYW